MDELLKKGLGKTGDHMNVPVDVASLVQQPAQVAGLRPAQGDHEGQQMGIVNLVDFIHIRREWTDPTASSTQDAPGSIDIERRFSRRRNSSYSHPILSVERPVFRGFSGLRHLWRESP